MLLLPVMPKRAILTFRLHCNPKHSHHKLNLKHSLCPNLLGAILKFKLLATCFKRLGLNTSV